MPGVQPLVVIWLLLSETVPLRANSRPLISVPEFAVMDVRAMTVPMKWELLPRVAEAPIFQNTLHGFPTPFLKATVLSEAVVRDSPTWKIQTAFGSPCASRVIVPVMPRPTVAV